MGVGEFGNHRPKVACGGGRCYRVCLRGRLVWEFYDELEWISTELIELSPNGSVMALSIPFGQWHTVKTLEILEMKDGPYEPIGPEDILG